MKLKMLGIIIMLVGLSVMACGISVFSGANAGDVQSQEETQDAVPVLKIGTYCLNGNASRGTIEINSDGTFIMNGAVHEYRFRVWNDIAATDEATGEITLTDMYFLGTNLDGGENFTDKIRFYPENDSLEYKGNYYFLQDNFE